MIIMLAINSWLLYYEDDNNIMAMTLILILIDADTNVTNGEDNDEEDVATDNNIHHCWFHSVSQMHGWQRAIFLTAV